MTRCGKLHNVLLDSGKIDIELKKIRLYETSVCSLMTFGRGTWTLTNPILRLINGVNSHKLTRFTGKSISAEVCSATYSLNLTHWLD